MTSDIAANWMKLSGERNWEGLLDPLDNDLRKYIIHYGERVEAIYDALDDVRTSNLHGFPRYAPENLFSNVGLQKGNSYEYTVTDYVYAMIDVNSGIDWALKDRPTWIGYVAVATDRGKDVLGRRDILICWRGTVLDEEWSKNLNFRLTSESNILGRFQQPEFHSGFYSLYTTSSTTYEFSKYSARDQVRRALAKLMETYKNDTISITVTGHSLGGALATLNAADIVHNRYNIKTTESSTACMVTAFVFASPMVGNLGFLIRFNEFSNLHLLRIRTKNDVVPGLPPLTNVYKHVGTELEIEFTQSTKLKIPSNPSLSLTKISHNLEIYLYGVAGPNADGNLVIDRDHSLVNKSLDVLKDDCGIPPNWWDPVKNKNMVQQENGKWKVERYQPEPPSA